MAGSEHVLKHRDIRRVLLVTLALNWLVAAAKLVIGLTSQSLAMVADGFHSLIDGSSNVVGLVAIYFAYKPADADHQYGHRKYEVISAMAISVGLFAVAWRILSEGLTRLSHPIVPDIGPLNFAVMIATLAVNIGVSTYEKREGQRLKSQFLLSDAAHTRSDVYASLSVIGSLVAAHLGYAVIDVLASLAIATIIVRVGYRIVLDGLGIISDQLVLEPAAVGPVVLAVDGVRGCDRIRTRGTEDHVFMDLVCYVPGAMTMRDAHQLADRIEARIREEFPQVKDIVVHLEPQG
jgi:cation diffusion facilitator family transporter